MSDMRAYVAELSSPDGFAGHILFEVDVDNGQDAEGFLEYWVSQLAAYGVTHRVGVVKQVTAAEYNVLNGKMGTPAANAMLRRILGN